MTILNKIMQSFPPKQLVSIDTQKASFWLIFTLSGAVFWLSPHPPMIDIPQHAGQVALLLDLLRNNPSWESIFYINYFTPYLLGYVLWALLATVMPIAFALKVLLSVTFYAFVFSGIYLRQCCKADNRLDWLLLSSFFGFCYNWGFLTFLMAAPLGVIFIAKAINFEKEVTPRSLIYLFLSGLALFFCHGLVFLMCMVIGSTLALTQSHSLKNLAQRWLPYIALVPIVALYFFSAKNNATTAQFSYDIDFLWLLNLDRTLQFISLPWGNTFNQTVTYLIGIVALFSPFLLGCRLNNRIQVWLPFLVVTLIWLTIPHFAIKTSFLYERFSLFIIPFYIILFIKPKHNEQLLTKTSAPTRLIVPCILPVFAFVFAIENIKKTLNFSRESSDFYLATQNVPEGKRIAALIYDRASLAVSNQATYTHYASWYQAEHKGIVDFSFAWFSPQPIRFKVNSSPSIKPGLEWSPELFNWEKHNGDNYDYFFVRGNIPAESSLLNNKSCSLKHFSSYGDWHVYQKILCKNKNIGN